MTDYRPRNSDLLYHDHEPSEDVVRVLAIFSAITTVTVLLVMAYLIDAYNPASTGFTAAIPARVKVAQQPAQTPAASVAASVQPGAVLAAR